MGMNGNDTANGALGWAALRILGALGGILMVAFVTGRVLERIDNLATRIDDLARAVEKADPRGMQTSIALLTETVTRLAKATDDTQQRLSRDELELTRLEEARNHDAGHRQ